MSSMSPTHLHHRRHDWSDGQAIDSLLGRVVKARSTFKGVIRAAAHMLYAR